MDMKKIIACAALVMGVVIFNGRLNAAVESDIVGYTTITTQAGYNMMGCVFKGLGSETVSLNDLLTGDFVAGDQVQLYVAATGGYTLYTYNATSGWMNGRVSADDRPVALGDSFWLYTPGREVTVTVKGAVSADNFTYTSVQGLQMVASTLPLPLEINGATWTGLSNGDQIQVANTSGGYTIYTYSTATGKWMQGRVPADVTIPVGSSMWLNTATAGVTLTVSNPLN